MDPYIKHLQETYNNTIKRREQKLPEARSKILSELCSKIDVEHENQDIIPVTPLNIIKTDIQLYGEIDAYTLQKSIQEDLPKGMEIKLYYETKKVCDTNKPNFFELTSNCTYVKNLMAELKW